MDKNISFTLKVWRQAGPKAKGAFETYQMISPVILPSSKCWIF